MKSKTARRASARVENRQRSSSSHSRVAKKLAEGIIVGVTDRAHRGPDACLLAPQAERDRGVLTAVVGMMDDAGRRLPLATRHVEGLDAEAGRMRQTRSPSTQQVYGLARVCRLWEVTRSTVYSSMFNADGIATNKGVLPHVRRNR
jgi:hypothetical protein